MFHGIINVYKEAGYTSFDVVAVLRGITKQKKIGHTGTLDPAAEGVLPVCLGNGTKLCEMLTDKTKEYEAVLLLGTVTDTEDTTGIILETKEVCVKEEQVRQVIDSFIGEYEQVPPMYSAIKVDGKHLYELAREGKEIERKARKVHIYGIEVLSVELPRVKIRVCCGKGTYIRSLCHDIGEKLGCGGCMEKLVRTRSGVFGYENALTISMIEELKEKGHLEEAVLPLEDALADYDKLFVKAEYKKKIDNGNPLPTDAFIQDISDLDKMYRVYNAEGDFFALYQFDKETGKMKPKKIFPITE